MSNSIAKRSIALLTAVLVMTAFTFIITENASAASKKTYYLATKVVSKDSKGEVYQDDEYTYDKNGLLKQWNSLDTKRTYLRNSKGYLTTKKVSNDKGQKMTFKVTKRNKYGLPLDSVGAEQVDIYKYKGKIMRETTATTA
jgi:hypothetical protein